MKYTTRILIVVLLALGMAGMSSPRPTYAASTITVSSCLDASNLEAAIAQANTDNAGDTITFSCSGDITFGLPTTLNITGNMTLDGSGQTVSLHEPVIGEGRTARSSA